MTGAAPVVEPDPSEGQVVITRFDCPNYRSLLVVLALHTRLKSEVRRHATGFIGIKRQVDLRRRTVLSISLWRDLDSVYSMGQVRGHVEATRVPRGFGITTSCGVFCFAGDWRRVLFGGSGRRASPLRAAAPGTEHSQRKEGRS